MQATYVEFPRKGEVAVRSEEVSPQAPEPWEAVIRNETSIISTGTELAMLQGMHEGNSFPARPGYGSIGRILSKGDDAAAFRVGDRVFYAGRHASLQRFKHGENHQWGCLFHVPEDLDAIDAAVGCMVEIAMTAPNCTKVALGDTVAVFGLGLVGNLAAQLYLLRGARVIGLDPVKERCTLARRVGIETVVDAAAESQVEAVKDLTGGKGASVAVDAAGHSAVIRNCVMATALFGQVVLLGSPRVPVPGNLTDILSAIFIKGLVVRGAHMWRYPVHGDRNVTRSVDWAFETTFELIARRRLRVRELISHVIQPERAPAAYEGLQSRPSDYTGVVIDWR